MAKSILKIPKGWSNPTIVETHPGTFTIAVNMDELSTQKWSELERLKLAKFSKKFLESKIHGKIITLKQYQAKHK